MRKHRWFVALGAVLLLGAASCAQQAAEAGRKAAARETERARLLAAQRAAEQPGAAEAEAAAREESTGVEGAPAAPEPATAGAPEIRIVATEFSFEPSSIELVVGEPVTITLVNQGAILHNVEIQGLEAEGVGQVLVEAPPGGSRSITFVPQSTGTYTFICNVPGHADAGMTGSADVHR